MRGGGKIIKESFFGRPAPEAARELLGKFLVRRLGRIIISGMITEVEAYDGFRDRASHAAHGRTKRTEVMFGKAGVWYVYLIYGMHHCLNIVTGPAEYPAAVLIRGVRIAGKELKGPGRVGRFFRIGRELNGAGADARSGLWIEDRGVKIGPRRIGRGKRIGVDYAGNWKNRLWRFFLKQRGGKKRSRVPPFS